MERLMFGWDFEDDAWSRFWRWNLIKICVWTCDKNSTLGSVVPLAMFSLLHSKDGRPPPSAPACRRTRCSVMLRTIKKGHNLIANSLTQCKGLLSWVTKARAAQCTLDNSDCTSQCPGNSLNFIIIYLTNWSTGIPLQRLEFFKLNMI